MAEHQSRPVEVDAAGGAPTQRRQGPTALRRLAGILGTVLLAACTSSGGSSGLVRGALPEGVEQAAEEGAERPVLLESSEESAVLPGTSDLELAAQTSAALYESAPVVVVAASGDSRSQARAASLAVSLGMPLLLSPTTPGAEVTTGEIERLGPEALLTVGEAAEKWAAETGREVVAAPADEDELRAVSGGTLGSEQSVDVPGLLSAVAGLRRGGEVPLLSNGEAEAVEAASEAGDGELPWTEPAETGDPVTVLVLDDPRYVAATATARSAGADVLVLADPDPRSESRVVRALGEEDPGRVVAVGEDFGEPDLFASRVEAARTGVELPGGGQLVLPGKQYVALYGHPGSRALGILGEQGAEASVTRAVQVANGYAKVRPDVVTVPTFEIITTVADAYPGRDGDYSAEATIEHLRPHVDAAQRAGVYVVLDLQPGYTDFLTQAKRYEELLLLPHVGLALDPEWRLAPGQRHMRQIGQVSAAEVNAVGEWLAALVAENDLPQKMLLLHQFKTHMLPDREQIVSDRDGLSVVTQMDGHGPPSTKLATWRTILQNAPSGMRFGWKNFYDEDTPTLTPAETLAVTPTPVFVSYQ